HVKAKLTCEKCHGKSEPESASSKKRAKGACVDCHGAHPSTREGHRKLAEDGKLGCVSCHTIHGPESGVRFSDGGDAVRFSTWAEQKVPGVSFHAGRTVTVPTIPISACQKCHSKDADDPLQSCRSFAGGGDLEPTVCFDEHRDALPPDLPTPKLDSRGRPLPVAPRTAPEKAGGVCADQHFDDRSFAWEAAREVVAEAPTVERTAKQGNPLGWFGAGAGFALLGYAATLGANVLAKKRSEKKRAPMPAASATKRLPVVNTSTCLGCYACVDACPYGVLEVERYVAVVARPDACCGLVLCEQRCPNGSLFVADEGALLEQPRISPSLESTEVPGLFLAGDVTGVPLIKNAIGQGVQAAEAVHRGLASRPRLDGAVDVCVVGAGPAGISSALRLKELGASVITIEQGGVAQSIKSFPRGKLVFDQPLELPVAGKLWLKESSKEELLLHWMRIVRKEGLAIREHTRMSEIERTPEGGFIVHTLDGDDQRGAVRARSVVLAIGQRGSPRLLPVPIPEEAESRVHYHLADARSLSGQKVIVAGLGDAAMEAAIALANQPRTSVTILARAATYARGQPRNIAELERLRNARRVDLRFSTEITEVQAGWLAVRQAGGRAEKLPFDALFVLIGSIPPWDTLARAGVSRAAPSPAAGGSVA
ncbi:MAG: NAD(P)-binding domain-containing protein, partial [Myxococcales bacterium]|nr:NAD(P)-binding domain-containing protein [Myxococcales bacterium]